VSDSASSAHATAAAELLERYIERRAATGVGPSLDELCREAPQLRAALEVLIARYERIETALDSSLAVEGGRAPATVPEALPVIPGFRTLERIGRGASGDVLKLEDLTLGRIVAGKILRADSPLAATAADFLREARALALFEDARIVRLLEYRSGEPPLLLMEYVDGYPLDELGPSLEYSQRARIVAEVAHALDRAHALGLQHRDLKPSHILVDARLQPKILDFGLSRGEPDRGHGLGTPAYMAPEQLDRGQAIDARTDVYALGVILYELLCGRRPYAGATERELVDAIRCGQPLLPVEAEPGVPEPLQAVALRAMSRDPGERYATAREMALDIERWLGGRPVLARPAAYRVALERRLRPHLEQIDEWERVTLVYPHEAERLRTAYRPLERREDDWIVGSRVLSLTQIALYLGAFLLASGTLLYLIVYLNDAIRGLLRPALALLAPFVVLNVAAHVLYQRERKAVGVAFALGAAALLPLALVILFREAGWLAGGADEALELFSRVTNRQLQVALAAACCWLVALAARTRTVALSSGAVALLLAFHLAVLGDVGLRAWVENERWDRVAMGLAPFLIVLALVGPLCERRRWPWFAEPQYFLGAALYVAVLELLALDGRALAHLGVTLRALTPGEVSDPHLLDTVAAMTVNGALIYAAGMWLGRHGTPLVRSPARLLCAVSPFAILEPLAYLSQTGDYSRRFDWVYLALAVTIVFLARQQQRRSFFYAGLVNTGVSLLLITDHYEGQDRPAWALAVLGAGTLALLAGFLLDWGDRRRRRAP
jgi:hypothetical protein